MTDFRFRFLGYKGLPTVRVTFAARDLLEASYLAAMYAERNGYRTYKLI